MNKNMTVAAKKIIEGDLSESTLREIALALRDQNEMLIGHGFGGTNELENLRHICGSCHQGIHAADNPKKEREKIGDYLARKIKW